MAFSNDDKLVLKKIFIHKEKRQFNECLDMLYTLKKEHKSNSVIYGLLGTIYYELKDYKRSARNFRKTLSLNPTSELASLGLFHSLIYLDNSKLALKELKRFVSLKSPKLYKVTINELYRSSNIFESKKEKQIISELYSKWCKSRRIPKVAKLFHLPG